MPCRRCAVSQQPRKEIVVGSLISVSGSADTYRWLGLVVDQAVGRRWVERDPCIEYDPPDKQGFVLVRVLGTKLTGMSIGRTGLPEQEPRETVTVRWAYPQLNQAYVIAGPDIASIEIFLKQCRICESLGMKGATFGRELILVVEYLQGVKRTEGAMSYFERQFLAMLKQVLPR